MKEHLSGKGSIKETYVKEYHDIISGLEAIGYDLNEFKIPNAEVKPVVVSVDRGTGEAEYSETKHVEPAYFFIKLDALLGYFSLTYDEKRPKVGFSPVH